VYLTNTLERFLLIKSSFGKRRFSMSSVLSVLLDRIHLRNCIIHWSVAIS